MRSGAIKRKGVKAVAALLAVLTLAALLGAFAPARAFAHAAEPKTVRLGYVNVEGYEEGGEGEPKSGYGYEYFQKISYYTNWKYEYVYGTFAELIGMLTRGEIDLMGDVTYRPERAEEMLFSERAMGSEKFFLFALVDNETYDSGSTAALNGARIGVEGTKSSVALAENWAREHHLNVTFVDCGDSATLTAALDAGKVDLMVMTDAAENFGYKPVRLIGSEDFRFAVAKDRPDLLEELNAALDVIQTNIPNYNDIVFSKYMGTTVGSYYLGKQEKAWLAAHGNTVVLGYPDKNMPYSAQGENGEPLGYVAALAGIMAERFGIRVEMKSYPDIRALFNAVKDGEVDAYGPTHSSLYLTEQYNAMQTKNIGETQLVLVFKGKEVKTDRIATTNRGMLFDGAIRLWYPKAELVVCGDVRACLKAVAEGKADCMLVPASQLNYLRQYREFAELNFIDAAHRLEICMFTKKGNAGLLQILDKTVAVAESELRGVNYMVDTYAEAEKSFADILRENTPAVLGLAAAVVAVLLFALGRAHIERRRSKRLNAELETSNRNLEKALAAAERANEAKSNFLFSMSHDVRTPMNAILGYAQLMKNGITDPKMLEYREKIETSGQVLLSVIDHVLDMAHIDSDKKEVREEPFSVSEIPRAIADVFGDEAAKKNITLQYTVDVVHDRVLQDPVKVNEIYMNIVSNAIKYTPEGGTVTARIEELPCDREGHALIRTTIADTGIGIGKEFLPHLFEPFARERSTTEGKVEGTGLGLTIVKKLVDRLGGTIAVESEPGKGTSFIVTLPHKLPRAAEDAAQTPGNGEDAAKKLSGKRILMAEDNDLNGEIVMAVLEGAGVAADWVKDGAACVELLKAEPAGSYDAILMDIQMPVMNGYQAARKIRRLEDAAKANIPIIAVTANAFEEDKRNAFLAGMNGFVAKPIRVESFLKTLAYLVSEEDAGGNGVPEGAFADCDAIAAFEEEYRAKGKPCGWLIYEATGREKIRFADAVVTELFGCQNHGEFIDYVGGSFRNMVHPDDLARVETEIAAQTEGSETAVDRVRYRIVRKDGAVRMVDDIGHKAFVENGVPVFYVGLADITDLAE
ncbi:MAG: transporter substrate-binding domain-containing protein [Clostridia bacterium]|nr:transporter substrate-binding domain-containing protein [Clostridia bacterium]